MADQILDKFQCEKNRQIEENFARMFSENQDTRLFFINENKAYTDGKNIIVDPAFLNIYRNPQVLRQTEEALSWPNLISILPWNALKLISRGLTLHECLHLIYSDFPPAASLDAELVQDNQKRVCADIANIIEDAYIEAVAASIYDNISIYLMFNNYAIYYSSLENQDNDSECRILVDYLKYMTQIIDYPFGQYELPDQKVMDYVQKTKNLF
ncbi:MAG: hypothetical protein K5839_00935, partial [Treponemataceae bacterium]|nr:hypothetical protein [Treponemataceae bacterium]